MVFIETIANVKKWSTRVLLNLVTLRGLDLAALIHC
jgi:hypothetical protein